MHIWSCLAEFFLEWEMFETTAVEKTKTHILCSVNFSFQIRNVYGIMWRNIAEPGMLRATIWRASIACLVLKATNSLPEYVILTDFPPQQWLGERSWMLRYTYIACLVLLRTSSGAYPISSWYNSFYFRSDILMESKRYNLSDPWQGNNREVEQMRWHKRRS